MKAQNLQEAKQKAQEILDNLQIKKKELIPQLEEISKRLNDAEVGAQKELVELFKPFGIEASLDIFTQECLFKNYYE